MAGFNVTGIISLQDAFSVVSKKVQASAARLQGSLAGVQAQAASSAGTLGNAGAAAGGATIMGFSPLTVAAGGLAAVLYKSVSAAMSFETTMAGVRKVMNLSKSATQELGNEILKLSAATPTSANSLAAIAEAGGQLGIAREDIMAFTDGINKLSIAFDMTANDAGRTFAKIKNAMGLTIEDTFALGDAMNHLSNNTAATASEIARSLTVFGATASAMNMTTTQASALAATLIETGRAPEMVGRGLNSILMTLTKIDKTAADKPIEALVTKLKELSKLPVAERIEVLRNTFGQQWADELVILTNNIGKFKSNLDLVADSKAFDSSALQEYNSRIDTTASRFAILGNRLAAIGTQIGNAILPVLDLIVSAVEGVISVFSKLGGAISSAFSAITPDALKGISLENLQSNVGQASNREALISKMNQPVGQQEVSVTGNVTVKNEAGATIGNAKLNKVGKNGAGRHDSGSYGY